MLHVQVKTPALMVLSALLSLLFVQQTAAQITIAPTTLFMTERSNVSNFLVINNSSEPQEVSVSFFFGYVKTDEEGNRQIINEDDELAAEYSLADWLRGFPRTFTLQPGERQTVRIRANPPSGLEDRTYWSRIRTSSNPVTPPVEEQQADAVTARINVKIDQVTGIYLKKGEVSTGIEVNNIELSQEDGQLTALVDVDKTGNSPFIGTITSAVTAEGEELLNQQSTTTIFVDGVHRFSFDISGLDPGDYQFNIRFETSRRDIRDEELIQGETATAAKEFMLSE
jgi:hypothetical protein